MVNLVNTLEAILFAAGVPLKRSELLAKLPEDVSRKNLNDAIDKLALKYSGDSGILLQIFEDKVQFCSNDKYGDIVSETLQPVKEKELTKSLMEVLSIIAYFQPITRIEIEEYRGGVAADYALSMLLKSELITTCGYKQTPGHPILYGTTDEFLKKFDLVEITDLPSHDQVKQMMYEIGGYNKIQGDLYREDGKVDDNDGLTDFEIQQQQELDDYLNEKEEMPEFLKDGSFEVYSGDSDGEEIQRDDSEEEFDDTPDFLKDDDDEIHT